jgi:hypothetical protein
MDLLKRIASKKPAISNEQLRRDWQKNLQFMDNISSFPEDWYLNQHLKKTARSKSHNTSIRSTESKSNNNNNNNNTNTNTNKKPAKESNNQDSSKKTDEKNDSNDYKDDFNEDEN